MILPELGRKDLYDRYDFNEPWNGPHNRMLVSEIPVEYQSDAGPAGYTDVVAVVGEGTVWPGATPPDLTHFNYSTHVLIVQANEPRNWMEPSDLSYESVMAAVEKAGGLDLVLGRGRYCVLANCVFERLPPDTTKEEVRRLLKVSEQNLKDR
jgi:hypothetical protein